MEHIFCNIKIYQITSSARVCSNTHSSSTDSSLLLTGSVQSPVFCSNMWLCVAERDFVMYHFWNDGSQILNSFTNI